jgi:hypothetical protein
MTSFLLEIGNDAAESAELDHRLDPDGNAARVRDEAELVSGLVELSGAFDVVRGRDSDRRAKGDPFEPAPALWIREDASLRLVLVCDYLEAAARAEREKEEHVAGGQGGEEEILRVVPARIAAERRIGAAVEVGLVRDRDPILAAVGGVGDVP